MSGSVIPAQNVAGSITVKQSAYRPIVKSVYPCGVRANAAMSDTIQSNDAR